MQHSEPAGQILRDKVDWSTLFHQSETPLFDWGSRYRLLRLYNLYRCLLGISLLGLSLTPVSEWLFSYAPQREVGWYLNLYLTVNFVLWLVLTFRNQPGTTYTFFVITLDIMMLSVLLHMVGFEDNGLANLYFVPIVIGNILLKGRLGILLSAIATLFLLSIDIHHALLGRVSQHVDAGLSGLLFFATALFVQSVRTRLQSSALAERLSRTRAFNLERLSTSIIQHMRTGILVLQEPDTIVMMNESARHLLVTEDTKGQLDALSPALMASYQQWLANPNLRPNSFSSSPGSPEILPNFSRQSFEQTDYVLIFLDDKAALSQEAQRLKLASLGQLTASIAHEIRNPLGAISHSAQLLAESETMSDMDQRLLTIIHKHCKRVNGIINNILQLSRKQGIHPESIFLNAWLREFIDSEHFQDFESPDIRLELPQSPVTVNIDLSQLQQVLHNLCQNGLRYSLHHTGKPCLILRAGVSASEHPWLEVEDFGPGIPDELSESVFEPFYTTDKKGTGLGLYICRELCEINQASLGLLPYQKERGSVFHISFAHPKKLIS
ncbi:two-component system sensor histidine kinase PilS [Kistimonas scapharcae]|uniref:histidine kinase n=1 Tax=Kistimonas scapharcae TaxID=1036133 RepID=A0ABP8V8D3_9GAMM